MKAWGEGKLREYLAPDLAKIDAADSTAVPAEMESKIQEREEITNKGILVGWFQLYLVAG